MQGTVTLEFSGLVPTVNHYWQHHGHRKYITKESLAWREQVGWECRRRHAPTFSRPLRVDVTFFQADNRRRDIDNMIKPLFDALQHWKVLVNDSLIEQFSVIRIRIPKCKERTVVKLTLIENLPPLPLDPDALPFAAQVGGDR